MITGRLRPPPDEPDIANQRRHGRVRVGSSVTCSLGEVLDISASGMRVRTRVAKPTDGQTFTMVLTGPDGEFTAEVRVVWSKRSGLRGREIGFEFVDLDDVQRMAIAAIARQAVSEHELR